MTRDERLDFALPNVGAGPDPFELRAVDADFVVLLFQRDYHCTNCREQVRTVANRYDEFRARNAVVASVLPEPPERAREWQEQYDLPFPLLADESAAVGEQYDQPVRFGRLGRLHDLVGRMPVTAVVDLRGTEPRLVEIHRGSNPWDRPSVDDLIALLHQLRDTDPDEVTEVSGGSDGDGDGGGPDGSVRRGDA